MGELHENPSKAVSNYVVVVSKHCQFKFLGYDFRIDRASYKHKTSFYYHSHTTF